MQRRFFIIVIWGFFICAFLYQAQAIAQDSKKSGDEVKAKDDTSKSTTKVSPHSKDMGIGPIKEIKLGPIDEKLVQEGKTIFNNQCVVCHAINEKKIGPPLRNITNEQTPEFIMNMLMNTKEMEQQDNTIKKMESKYPLKMTDLNLSQEKARAVLEYLRTQVKKEPSKPVQK